MTAVEKNVRQYRVTCRAIVQMSGEPYRATSRQSAFDEYVVISCLVIANKRRVNIWLELCGNLVRISKRLRCNEKLFMNVTFIVESAEFYDAIDVEYYYIGRVIFCNRSLSGNVNPSVGRCTL